MIDEINVFSVFAETL